MKEWTTLKRLIWLRATNGSALPDGYTKIAGITMNDNCYYAVEDFKLKGSDTLRFSFSVTAACNVIGAYSGSASGNNYSLYVGTTGSGKYLRYKNGAYDSAVDPDTRYDVIITPTGTNGMKTDSTWSELDFTTTTDLCIGTTSTSTSSAKLKGTLYGKVTVDGRATFIPAKRTSDNALGYYSPETEKFYENQGGGTPSEYIPL